MIHKEFWGILFLFFVGWIFYPGDPNERIGHACRPIAWTGNVVVSVSSLVLPNQQTRVQGWFDKFEYGCKYTTWRLIYQEAYNAEQAALKSGAPTKKAVEPEVDKQSGKAPAPPAKEQGK